MTIRLADSLPSAAITALLLRDNAVRLIDHELDGGLGDCWLRRDDIASLVQDALLHFDGGRYRLLARCLMPNHVHFVVEMIGGSSLIDVMKSLKSFTARRANAPLGRAGAFWHPDYFDRYMRDEGHLSRTIAYVENNPVKAGLVEAPTDWLWSSAQFRNGDGDMSGPGGPRSG